MLSPGTNLDLRSGSLSIFQFDFDICDRTNSGTSAQRPDVGFN
jgi:hypothetical protein